MKIDDLITEIELYLNICAREYEYETIEDYLDIFSDDIEIDVVSGVRETDIKLVIKWNNIDYIITNLNEFKKFERKLTRIEKLKNILNDKTP